MRKRKKKKEVHGTCEICGKAVSATHESILQFNLKVHKQSQHAIGKRDFYCHLCPKGYFSPSDLTNHYERLHTPDDVRPFVCEFESCNKSFKTKVNMKQHMHYHRPPRFKCEKCKKEFYWSPVLKHHKCSAT